MIETFYQFAYLFTWSLHTLAFYWAVKTWKDHDDLFRASNITHFFRSRIEREFIAVLTGMLGNLCFMILKPFYIVQFGGLTTGWQEPLFVLGHMCVGIGMVVWHQKAYKDMENHRKASLEANI